MPHQSVESNVNVCFNEGGLKELVGDSISGLTLPSKITGDGKFSSPHTPSAIDQAAYKSYISTLWVLITVFHCCQLVNVDCSCSPTHLQSLSPSHSSTEWHRSLPSAFCSAIYAYVVPNLSLSVFILLISLSSHISRSFLGFSFCKLFFSSQSSCLSLQAVMHSGFRRITPDAIKCFSTGTQ